MLLIPLLSVSVKAQNLKVHRDNNQNIKTFLSALERNNIEQMDMLLSSKMVWPNNTYIYDEHPVQNRPIIVAAIEMQNYQAIELLIKYGVDINKGFQVEKTKYNPYGGRWGVGGSESMGVITVYPINIAFDNWNGKILKYLIDKGVKLENAVEQIKKQNLNTIEYFTQFVKLSFTTEDLNAAIKSKDLDKTYFLLRSVKPNSESLVRAVEQKNMVLFDSLINRGANVNDRMDLTTYVLGKPIPRLWYPICAAVLSNNINAVKKIVEYGANINCNCTYIDGTVIYTYKPTELSTAKRLPEITDFLVLAPLYLKKINDSKYSIQSYIDEGLKYLESKDTIQALSSYKKAWSVTTDTTINKMVKDHLKKKSLSLYKEKKFNDAANIYRIAYQITNDNEFLYKKADCYFNLENYQKAIDDYTIVINNSSSLSCIAYRNRGYNYAKIEKYKQSIEDMLNFSKCNSSKMSSSFWIAWSYAMNNDKNNAISYLKQSIEQGFNSWSVLEAESGFEKIRNSNEFQEIVNSLKK